MAEVLLFHVKDESPEDLVDAYARFEMQISRRHRYLEQRIREMCEDAPPDQPVVLRGRVYQVQASAVGVRSLRVVETEPAAAEAAA